MDDKRKLAADRAALGFKSGLNCAECVLEGLIHAGAVDLPPELLRLATGFGGGIGLSGNTCGALSAAVMALGAAFGRPDPYALPDEVRGSEVAGKHYRRYNRLVHDFAERFGSAQCREICAPFGDFHGKERRVNCLKLCAGTAELTCDYLAMDREEGFTLPYRDNMADME